jgi:hypothetical protein
MRGRIWTSDRGSDGTGPIASPTDSEAIDALKFAMRDTKPLEHRALWARRCRWRKLIIKKDVAGHDPVCYWIVRAVAREGAGSG